MAVWHLADAKTLTAELETDITTGLTEEEAARRLGVYGANELVERERRTVWHILWEQVRATMVVILIVAAVISMLLGDLKDTIAILAIVIINVALGVFQDFRAEKALAALRQFAVPNMRVKRDGHERVIPSSQLVPGDIVLLEAGNVVPADGRVLESRSLRAQEATLTGESSAVEKSAETLSGDNITLGDRTNMVYMGTTIAFGRGVIAVTETGMRTELGHIAEMLQGVERMQTPLQRRLDHVGRVLVVVALALVAIIFALGVLRGEPLKDMLLTSVSIAVAAIPEGLPAAVTIALALGAQRMLKRNALIRKLPAVETLGSVTTICSDKTGTLTQNRMTVTVLSTPRDQAHMDALLDGHRQAPSASAEREPGELSPSMRLLLAGSALCTDATLEPQQDGAGTETAIGDPTEAALVVAGARVGLAKPALEHLAPRIAELPFDSDRKRMTTIHHLMPEAGLLADVAHSLGAYAHGAPGAHLAFVKGATGGILDASAAVWTEDGIRPLDAAQRAKIQQTSDDLAGGGLRVLALAMRLVDDKELEHLTEQSIERDLIFVGQVGMIDPVRPEAIAAVARCHQAGIRTIMITGDHPLTARTIAAELGISDGGGVLTGQQIAALTQEELVERVRDVNLYARVAPEQKLSIVRALQEHKEIVAMTGDGVNDAPALKQADIGVAMGITGTDVSKQAADLVLLDDNFATIAAAVEEGRMIYDNIRKFIRYLLSTNSGEIWVMILALVLGLPLPLLPVQILWMNLVTDGLPALALSTERAERFIMRRPPRPPSESIFAHGMGTHIIWVGVLMAALALGTGIWTWPEGITPWRTVIFTTLTLAQLAHVIAIRSERDSIFRIGLFSNRPLTLAIALTLLLQAGLIYVPFLQPVFGTTALSAPDLGLCVLFSSVIFFAVELEKLIRRRRSRGQPAKAATI